MVYATRVNSGRPRIYHVGGSEPLRILRDDILRLHGFEVVSTLSTSQVLQDVIQGSYHLVLIDVEGDNRVPAAVRLCDEIKHALPDQTVAYVCNHRVSINSDCPDEIIRAEFDPEALVRSVKEMIARSGADDQAKRI